MRRFFALSIASALLAFSPVTRADDDAGAPPATGGEERARSLAGPYLQHLAATRVDVKVELFSAEAASLELVVPSADPGVRVRTLTSPAAAFHDFKIEGLTPSTTYKYTVKVGGLAFPQGQFVTAPADASDAPFAFVVYGDTRSNDQAHAAVVHAILKQPFDFLVNTGDFVAAGGEGPLWQRLFLIERDLLRDHCVFACVGNHELVDDETASRYLRYFGPGDPSGGDPYGTFRWGRARFFLLNAFQDWGQGELSWLERALADADKEEGLAFRFVVVHRSPWSSGRHGDDAKMLAAGVPALLVKHGVDLVIAGHDHIYERGELSGLKYLISGGAGAPIYTENHKEPSTRRMEPTYNFVRVAVEAGTVRAVAQRPDGSLIESCGFQHGQAWDCDAHPQPAASGGLAEAPPSPESPAPKSPSSKCGCEVPGLSSSSPGWLAVFGATMGAVLVARRRRRDPR